METIEALKKNKVFLEICPDSNLDTKAVYSIGDHPIRGLVDLGVNVTISTDIRTVSNTSLDNEYN